MIFAFFVLPSCSFYASRSLPTSMREAPFSIIRACIRCRVAAPSTSSEPPMIIIKKYTVQKLDAKDTYKVLSNEAPVCPSCGILMSGYDSRKRHCIDRSGEKSWYLLRRLRCPGCRRLHLELPDFMIPVKHYEAHLIHDTIAGTEDACPAEDSTIRRWKKHPPGLPRK